MSAPPRERHGYALYRESYALSTSKVPSNPLALVLIKGLDQAQAELQVSNLKQNIPIIRLLNHQYMEQPQDLQ
jgi:hypothetical protein